MSTIAALIAWLVTLALLGVAIAFGLATRGISGVEGYAPQLEQVGGFGPMLLAYATVGALLAARRPRNPIGWLFVLSALCGASGLAASGYGVLMRGTLDAAAPYVIWLARQLSNLMFLGMILVLPLFPTGTIESRLQRTAVGLALVSAALQAATQGLVAWPNVDMPNPFAVGGLDALFRPGVTAAGIFLILALLAAIASLVARYRRGSQTERLQMRWLLYAALLTAATSVVLGALGASGQRALANAGFVILLAGLGLIPVSVGIAILRYRLYDIDLLINRTLVYGALTATLLATYATTVLSLGQILSRFTLGSDLAVAGSTLLVAALFQPVRRRIQSAVDRRFYRRRYDAQQTVAGYAAYLRQEVDLDALSGELLTVARETMQPQTATVWLRRMSQP